MLRTFPIFLILGFGAVFPVWGNENTPPSPHHSAASGRRNLGDDSLPDSAYLRLAEPLDREIKGGETHTFRIVLSAGQFMHLSVEQQSINVALALRDPAGKLLGEMDSPNNTFGPECLSWVAESSGEINLEVRSLDKAANPGRIVVLLEELRPMSANDSKRVSAERVFMEAEHLSNPTPAELQQEKLTLGKSREKAIARFNEALPDWHAAADSHGEAMTYFRIGQNHKLLGDLKMALENFDKGLAMQLEPRDWRLTAGMLNDAGVVYESKNEFDRALMLLGQAKQLFAANQDRRGQATAHNNFAHVLGITGKPNEALNELQQALLLRQLEHDQSGEINVLNNMGGMYDLKGEPHRALEHFSHALEIWRQLGNRNKIPIGLNNTAAMHEKLGEWQKAIDDYKEALELYREIGDRAGEADALDNLGDMYETLGSNTEAQQNYSEALHIARDVVGNKGTEANVLAHIARLDASARRLDQALDGYNKSLSIPQPKRRQAEALTGIGSVYVLKGNLPEALHYYEQALKLRAEVEDPKGEAITLDRFGEALFLSGQQEKALEKYERAVGIWKKIEDQLGLASSLEGMSRIQLEAGNLTEALNLSKEAISIVESRRTKVTSHQLRATYFATKQNYYENLINIQMGFYKRDHSADSLAEGFHAAESSRARSFIDTLTDARIDFANLGDEQLRRYGELRDRINAKSASLTKLLNGTQPNAQLELFKKDLTQLLAEEEQLWKSIATSHPEYAVLVQPQPLTPSEIQQQLDAHTLLLEYFLGDKRSYVWVVSQDSVNGIELGPRDLIEVVARRVTDALTARNREEKNETFAQAQLRFDRADKEYADASTALSKLVLEPVASLLGQKRLVVVADGALQLVPFAALPLPASSSVSPSLANSSATPSPPSNVAMSVSKRPTNQNARNVSQTLITEHEIVTLASASVLALQRRELANRKPARLAVAVLADPVFDLDDARVARATGNGNGNQHSKTLAKTGQANIVPPPTGSAAQVTTKESVPGTQPPSASRPTSGSQSSSGSANSRMVLASALRDVGLDPNGKMPRLVRSRQEARAIIRAASADQSFGALDFNASRETAMSAELSKYQIIHFATHGVLDLDHPELSGIVLSMVNEKGQPVDGYLRLHEIYNLNLPAELVVLSACQTGIGKQIKGEGLIALTRGFMYAGAKSVVASLWKVDDAATSALMADFYQQMFTNKLKPAAALRAAQLNLKKQKRWQSPYYWAGFFIQGEWK